ncbi:hypothetical protein A5893_09540 [Pedobacter psychrophilus]|uniref:Secretion system C-terminal sorting domain-containing protein n=1 Tax=Pedobacter psychrophilus TaxID=1826909 RepID=A0A179DH41_9SPHI|nr:T9SS type A sorting domain-containing protein [Pedobacter psychrophilus]OAQ39809.1 hypothetical protein A5893_09540 [Pedobacter psychrophilus]
MKKIYSSTVFLFALIFCTSTTFAQNFVSGNLVVTRVGDGSTALSANTAPISLLEFTTIGVNQATPIKTVTLGSTTGSRLTIGGNLNEGQISLSTDRNFLSLAGYDVAAGELATSKGISNITVGAQGSGYTFSTTTVTISAPQTAGVTATASANITSGGVSSYTITNAGSGYTSAPTVTITSSGAGTGATATATLNSAYWQGFSSNKVIARVNNTGAVDYTTNFPSSSFQSNGSVKGAISTDGSSFYLNAARVEYVPFGQTTSSTLIFSQNSRSIGLHGGQLYFASGFSTTPIRFTTTALPTSTVTATNLPGITTNHDLCGFSFLNVDNSVGYLSTGWDLLYIAKFNNGLEKWFFDGTNWVLAGNYAAAGNALSSIAVNVNALGQPVIYAVTGNNTGSNNTLVAITDAGARTVAMTDGVNSSFITLATAGTNYGFRGVAFTPGSTVLPIKLTSFKGEAQGRNNKLTWATSSEVNFKEFVVERSADGKAFTAVGSPVLTKGVTTGSNYSFIDFNGAAGTLYYRLKSVDNDGTFDYSEVIAIKSSLLQTESVVIYPNPTTGPLTVQHAAGLEKASISVIDLGGKELKIQSIEKNSTSTSLDLNELKAGVYFIQVLNGEKSIIKLIKN